MSEHAGPPKLFDRRRLRANRQRAGRMAPDGGFLARVAGERLAERLADIPRTWRHALFNGPPVATAFTADQVTFCDLAESRLWQQQSRIVCDEEALPFAPTSFDLILSNATLQSVNDLPGTLIQFRKLLVPDGLLLAVLLGGESLVELRQAMITAESQQTGKASLRVAPFADVRELGNLLQRSGFALPVADVDRISIRYPNLLALAHDLRGLGEGNALAERERVPIDRATLAAVERTYRDLFPDEDGIRATFDLIFLSGWAPHPDQPKPLAPGSARHSLAEALKPGK